MLDFFLVTGTLTLVSCIWLGMQVAAWSTMVSKVKDTTPFRHGLIALAIIGPFFAFVLLLVGGLVYGNHDPWSLIFLPVFVGVSALLSLLGLKIATYLRQDNPKP